MRRPRAHYSGDYQTRRRYLIAAANRDPTTLCWRCRRTLADHPAHKNGRPAYWTAGHIRDGDPTSPLAAEASTCNYKAGGRLGSQRRRGGNGNPNSRQWFPTEGDQP